MNRTVVLSLVLLALPAHAANTVVLRIATAAPEGSPWTREMRAMGRELERETQGSLTVKWYMNGVAGEELEMGERIRRRQLDGVISGQMLCERAAPSMRVSHMPGLFQSRHEATVIMNRLQSTIEDEAHQSGFVMLATSGLGPSVYFARTPARTMDELRRLRLWRWDLDEVGIAASRAMGLRVVPTPIYDASRAYDHDQLDGFMSIPAAALVFQWSAQVRYVIDLRSDYLWGCLLVSERSFQQLSVPLQQTFRQAAARMRERLEEVGRRVDEALLGGAFEKQGLVSVPISESFRAEFFAAARAARERVAEGYVSKELLSRVQQMLADYRAEHGTAAR